jgi:hypothetical protein
MSLLTTLSVGMCDAAKRGLIILERNGEHSPATRVRALLLAIIGLISSTPAEFRKRKMSAAISRRNSLVVSTLILLAGAPNYSHAHNLRRSSEGDTNIKSSSLSVEGFEVLGDPFYHISGTTYARRRSTVMQSEEKESDSFVESTDNEESIVFVSDLLWIEEDSSITFMPLTQKIET